MQRSSAPAGHAPTLVACFLHFDVCFMLWVLVGAMGIYVADSAHLDAAQKGFLVAVPILTGSLLRVPLGLLSDRIGGKRVGVGILALLVIPLALGWRGGDSLAAVFVLAATLGIAGASFAVVLPLASRWYAADRQGLVMGIAAAGNSGTVLANVFAPRLAGSLGWHRVFGLALVPLSLVLVLFMLMAKESPRSARRPLQRDLGVLKQPDMWWFCLFYAITFGGYVGLSSFLPLLLRDHFRVTPVAAGSLTAVAALIGSGARPIGGYLADTLGGARLLRILLLGIAAAYAIAASLPRLEVMEGLLVAAMACLGMGNGAVFQLVPQRFSSEMGIATGVIGAIGGLGGFLLPTLLGGMKQATGSFGPGFAILALAAGGASILLQTLVAFRSPWRRSWRADLVPQTESY